MQYLIDQIGAIVIASFLVLMVTTSNLRTNEFSSEILYSTLTQNEANELNNIISKDFNKIGYGITGEAIKSADSNCIQFKTDYISPLYPEGDGIADEIHYYVGSVSEMSETQNPNDMPLYRDLNNNKRILLGRVTKFNLAFFDKMGE